MELNTTQKFSFKLGINKDGSSPSSSTGGSKSNFTSFGLNNRPSSSSAVNTPTPSATPINLGFSCAQQANDSSLRAVTAFTGVSKMGFIGEKLDINNAANRKRLRQAEPVVIPCKKRLIEAAPSSELDPESQVDHHLPFKAPHGKEAFEEDLKNENRSGLIINRAPKSKPPPKSSAPLLIRMGHFGSGSTSSTRTKNEASTHDPRVKSEPSLSVGVISPSSLVHANDKEAGERPDFTKVKVEDFGMAMLRGMGYDPEKPEYKDRDKTLAVKIRAYAHGGLGSDKAFESGRKEENLPHLKKKKGEETEESDSYYSDEDDLSD